MTIAWNQAYRLAGILTIFIGVFMGCASVMQFFEDGASPERFTADEASLEHALTVYQYGDYKEAMGGFNALSNSDAGESQRRTAQLGEICCRLMLAETAAEYTIAGKMWEQFRSTATGFEAENNLVLFDPMIVRLSALGVMRRTEPKPPSAKVPKKKTTTVNKKAQNEVLILKKKATQADQLQRHLDAVVAENQSLKEKIKALEAIDQNIQKKKTEISAPSE